MLPELGNIRKFHSQPFYEIQKNNIANAKNNAV